MLKNTRIGDVKLAKWITNKISSQKAYTIMEMSLSLGIALFIIAGATWQFSNILKSNRDLNLKAQTAHYANNILRVMEDDFENIGVGLPFEQDNFEFTDNYFYKSTGFSNAQAAAKIQPVELASLKTYRIKLRRALANKVYVVTSDFRISDSYVLSLDSVSDLAVDDKIYISNATMLGEEGCYGKISAIDAGSNTVTISSSEFVATRQTGGGSPQAVLLEAGSIAMKVSEIEYLTSANVLKRYVDGVATNLAPNSAIIMQFLDANGVDVPGQESMTQANLYNKLALIKVSLVLEAPRSLSKDENSDGSNDIYQAQIEKQFNLPKLNYLQNN